MIRLTQILSLFLALTCGQVVGQSIISFEVYGGPSVGYVDGEGVSPTEEIGFLQRVGYHVGGRALGHVTDNLQLLIEGEYLHRPVATQVRVPDGSVSINTNTRYSNNFGNYALGLRISPRSGPTGFYFQPSVGFALNRSDRDFFSGATQAPSSHMRTSLSARIEAGVKMDIGGNYMVFGLRHHQGFQQLDGRIERFPAQDLTIDFRSSASYCAFFVGFGIPTGWFVRQ